MSAYGHQMEREYSAENLSSRGDSERESHYVMESGFYMTSFAATIFIAALATFGVLLVALLITLTVMLQSCESRSAGVIEAQKSAYEYDTCKTLALHAQLNNLEGSQFPITCRASAIWYIEEGQYARDLNSTVSMLENYLERVHSMEDGLDVFLLDIDDVLSPNTQYANLSLRRNDKHGYSHCIEVARHLKHMIILRVYTKLHAKGWPIILFSRRPEGQRNVTIEHLLSAGYRDWSSLILRSKDEVHIDSREYFSRRRVALQNEGFRFAGAISSQFDALTGPYSGGLVFKLSNPIYFNFDNQNENTDIPA